MSSTRKQEILLVAQELIQSVGYAGFSYQDIATKLGIAKPSIHHHFATKEALGLALMDEYRRSFNEILEGVKSGGLTPAGELSMFLDQAADDCHSNDQLMCPGGTLHSNFGTFPPSIQDAVTQLSNDFVGWMADLLKRGLAAGELRFEGSAEDAAWQLSGTILGGRLQARTHGPKIWDVIVAQIKTQWLVSGA